MKRRELELDLYPAEIKALLAEGLADRRRLDTGPHRLIAMLVRQGLDERALVPAAALVLELDRPREAP
jgi:hypothetical protein